MSDDEFSINEKLMVSETEDEGSPLKINRKRCSTGNCGTNPEDKELPFSSDGTKQAEDPKASAESTDADDNNEEDIGDCPRIVQLLESGEGNDESNELLTKNHESKNNDNVSEMTNVLVNITSNQDAEGEAIISQPRRRIRKILDSDSENEEETKQSSVQCEKPANKTESEMPTQLDENDLEHEPITRYNRLRTSKLIDSDSEEEETSNRIEANDNVDVEHEEAKIETNNIEIMGNITEPDSTSLSKRLYSSKLVDSDSEDESKSGNKEEENKNSKKSKKIPEKKPIIPEMKTIKSESQRLAREAHISIPYHKPKQHSLKEFLNRRTISTRSINNERKRFSNPLKMSAEELVEYAKHLEEREKEAIEFFTEKDDKQFKKQSPKIVNEIIESDKINDEKTIELKKGESEDILEQSTKNVNEVVEQESKIDELNLETEENIVDDSETFTTENQSNEIEVDNIDNAEECDPLAGTLSQDIFASNTEEIALSNRTIEELSEPVLSEPILSEPVLSETVLSEPVLSLVPSLKGNANMIIDLESNELIVKEKTGPEKLFEKFLNHNVNTKRKNRSSVLSILSQSNDPEKIGSPIIILSDEEQSDKKNPSIYLKIKEKLKKRISLKRKEDILKKREENSQEFLKTKSLEDEEEEELLDEELLDEEKGVNVDQDEEVLIDEEDEEQDIEGDNDDKVDDNENYEIDDEEEFKNEEEESGHEDSNSSDDELPANDKENEKRGFKRLKLLEMDSDNDDDEQNGFDKQENAIHIDKNQSFNFLNDSNGHSSENVDENELMALCSGKFDPTQQNLPLGTIPNTQMTQNINESQLMALCSGTFGETPDEVADTSPILEGEVPDLSSSDEEQPKETVVVKRKKLKKLKKLKFSDDEGSSSEDENQNVLTVEEEKSPIKKTIKENQITEGDTPSEDEANLLVEEQAETYIDYDSEENEIEVQMTKKDCHEKATEFLEHEAELSDSEWGSADEDEKDLDKYDIELGDEDEFDREKLHSDLEKIHMRRLLDDDTRELKKIQEMLFESEELDGVGRQRQFRWKNVDNSFSLGDANNPETGQKEDSEEEDELLWRKIRHERELLLKNKELHDDDFSLTSISKIENSPNTSIKKKITILQPKRSNSTTVNSIDTKFLITKTCEVTNTKGSFLVRGQDTLSKLTTLLKSNAETDDGMQIKTTKAGKFVFSTIDPGSNVVEQKAVKRKPDKPLANFKENDSKRSKLSFI